MGIDYEEGFYWLSGIGKDDPVLVHLYFSGDWNCKGVGFNTHDGGGFLPLSDMNETSLLERAVVSLY